MLAATAAVLAAVALCLLFPETRWIGVLGAAVLSYLHPLFLLSSAVVAALVAVMLIQLRRRSVDGQAADDP